MVMLRPLRGLKIPSVRTILFRASYTPLYWAFGSGCRLCILVWKHTNRNIQAHISYDFKHLLKNSLHNKVLVVRAWPWLVVATFTFIDLAVFLCLIPLLWGAIKAPSPFCSFISWRVMCVSKARCGTPWQLFGLFGHAKLSVQHKACYYLWGNFGTSSGDGPTLSSTAGLPSFPSFGWTIKYPWHFRWTQNWEPEGTELLAGGFLKLAWASGS